MSRCPTVLSASLLAVLVSVTAGAQPLPGLPTPGQVVMPRDTGPAPATGTGVIRGRVTDADTGAPIRRAMVQLSQRAMRGEPRGATTDDQGRFEFRDLAAGEFMVLARKPGYASLGFGQRRANEAPRPLTLGAAEVFDRCDIALERGGVITGRVLDEIGEPVLEASVRVLRRAWFRGRRRLMAAGVGTTNDLGTFRVFGLPPGDYLVQASTRFNSWGFGRDERPVDYAPTYYPGTPDVSSAQPVAVTPAQESVADLTLATVRLTTIAGQALSSTGKPLTGGRVVAMPQPDGDEPFGFEQPRSAMVKADGTFEVTGLAPGTYQLSASASDGFFGGDPDREFALQTVSVGGEPVRGLTLALAPGGVARGRVVFQGTPPADLGGFRLMARPTDDERRPMMGGGRPPALGADGSFELTGLVGRQVITWINSGAGPLQGWGVKAVLVGGRDVQDSGIDFAPGRAVSGIEVVMSREFASISGTVTDDRGQPVKDYGVIAFSDDREKWFLPSMRWLKSARANQDGLFRMETLAAGRFLLVAVEGVDASDLGDPEHIEKLRAFATEVTLADTEKKTVTLTLARP